MGERRKVKGNSLDFEDSPKKLKIAKDT